MQFIALSYVWGSKDASDIPAGDGLPTQTPKVIDDAIAATQYMGYNYLWVDRYCIPQDNPEAKHCQIRSMDIIYECATVTIIAATGDDPSYGLPGVASTRRVPQEFVDIGSGTLVLLYPDIDYQLSKTRWDTRAWTYQEGLLSCRRLFFLDNQVYFQCNSIRCMESIVTPSEADDSLYRRSPLYMYDLWNNHIPFPDGRVGDVPEELLVLIDTYTERELGFQSDALNAFEGILRRFVSAAKPVYHIWGIPIFTSGKQILDRLVAGFLWRLRVDDSVLDSLGQEQRRAPYPGTMRRRLFPSWSWVDWNGRCLVRSGFRIRTARIYDLMQYGFKSLVTLSMELVNGREVFYVRRDGLWIPKSEYHDCTKEEGLALKPRVSTDTHDNYDDWVPKLSTLEIYPPVLRLVGYTCDAVLWHISDFYSEKGEPIHREVEDA